MRTAFKMKTHIQVLAPYQLSLASVYQQVGLRNQCQVTL